MFRRLPFRRLPFRRVPYSLLIPVVKIYMKRAGGNGLTILMVLQGIGQRGWNQLPAVGQPIKCVMMLGRLSAM